VNTTDPNLAALLSALGPVLQAAGLAVPATMPAAVFSGDLEPGHTDDSVTPLPLLRDQQAVRTGTVLDFLFFRHDGSPLRGIPAGCTTVLAGPPGSRKTRTALHALARVALQGVRCGLVLAEEAWRDPATSGREDLCSRFTRSAMQELSMDEHEVRADIVSNIRTLETLHHASHDWPAFISRYRRLVEHHGVLFTVVDSLTAIDANRGMPAKHLAQLRTYNAAHGVTCLVVSQIKDSGAPAGGEPLVHAADAGVLIERRTLTSKEEAARYGLAYKDEVDVAVALKSATTRTYGGVMRVDYTSTGVLTPHANQPTR
jgi:KaiC/GvpD/RAD55 family RecA-like ATPase